MLTQPKNAEKKRSIEDGRSIRDAEKRVGTRTGWSLLSKSGDGHGDSDILSQFRQFLYKFKLDNSADCPNCSRVPENRKHVSEIYGREEKSKRNSKFGVYTAKYDAENGDMPGKLKSDQVHDPIYQG